MSFLKEKPRITIKIMRGCCPITIQEIIGNYSLHVLPFSE